jgi:hypothetical protein
VRNQGDARAAGGRHRWRPERAYGRSTRRAPAEPRGACAARAGHCWAARGVPARSRNVLGELDRAARGDAAWACRRERAARRRGTARDGRGSPVDRGDGRARAHHGGGAVPRGGSARIVSCSRSRRRSRWGSSRSRAGWTPASSWTSRVRSTRGRSASSPRAWSSAWPRAAPRGDPRRARSRRAGVRRIFYLPEPFRLVIDVATTPPTEPAPPVATGHAWSPCVLDAGTRRARSRRDGAERAPREGRHPRHRPPGGAAPGARARITTLMTRDATSSSPSTNARRGPTPSRRNLFVSIHCNASRMPRRTLHDLRPGRLEGRPGGGDRRARERASPAAAAESPASWGRSWMSEPRPVGCISRSSCSGRRLPPWASSTRAPRTAGCGGRASTSGGRAHARRAVRGVLHHDETEALRLTPATTGRRSRRRHRQRRAGVPRGDERVARRPRPGGQDPPPGPARPGPVARVRGPSCGHRLSA